MTNKKYIFEPLEPDNHERVAFSCGSAELDHYLQKKASQDTKRGISVTYVLCDIGSSTIIGYYSISTASIETHQLPESHRKRLPRYQALPAMLIGRMAIDRHYQGQGQGSLLLSGALARCWRLSKEIGSIAVVVHAKDEQAALFYEHYGFRRFADNSLHLFMPMAEIAKLGLA